MKKNELILEPMIADENVLVQFTDTIITDKFLTIKVPNGFQAIVFIDEKVAFKINTCVGKKFVEYGKEYLNRQCKVAFVRTKLLSQMMWGFGNIQVNNDRLKEAYRVGANGKYSVEIAEIGRLINCFDYENNITIEMVRDKTISIIKNLGTAVLGGYFAKTDISVFEIASLTAELRSEMIKVLKDEIAFTELGLKLKDLVVDSIHVNEEDLELIRNRINDTEIQTQKVETPSIDYLAELHKAQKEIADELSEKFNEQLKNFQDIIVADMEEKIQELLPLQDSAKDDYIETVKLTAESIIAKAENEDDFIPAVAMIYSNVEDNLINKFHLRHENKTFVMEYEEYEDLAEEARIGNYYILKRKDRETGKLEVFVPKIIKENEYGEPELVEMLPVVRFIKAGLNVELAKKASDYWIVLNKIRHKSEDNIEYLSKYFVGVDNERKFLQVVLEFFKNNGLYTKE